MKASRKSISHRSTIGIRRQVRKRQQSQKAEHCRYRKKCGRHSLRVSDRIQRLEDESAIENLQRIYGFYVDKQLWKEAADLFADDGTLEIGGQGVFAGKSRVLEYLVRISPDGLTRGKLFNHIQLQPIIDVAPDGNTAKGRWRFLS